MLAAKLRLVCGFSQGRMLGEAKERGEHKRKVFCVLVLLVLIQVRALDDYSEFVSN